MREIRPHLRAARDFPELEDLMLAPGSSVEVEIKFPIKDNGSSNQEPDRPNPRIIGETTNGIRWFDIEPLELLDNWSRPIATYDPRIIGSPDYHIKSEEHALQALETAYLQSRVTKYNHSSLKKEVKRKTGEFQAFLREPCDLVNYF